MHKTWKPRNSQLLCRFRFVYQHKWWKTFCLYIFIKLNCNSNFWLIETDFGPFLQWTSTQAISVKYFANGNNMWRMVLWRLKPGTSRLQVKCLNTPPSSSALRKTCTWKAEMPCMKFYGTSWSIFWGWLLNTCKSVCIKHFGSVTMCKTLIFFDFIVQLNHKSNCQWKTSVNDVQVISTNSFNAWTQIPAKMHLFRKPWNFVHSKMNDFKIEFCKYRTKSWTFL